MALSFIDFSGCKFPKLHVYRQSQVLGILQVGIYFLMTTCQRQYRRIFFADKNYFFQKTHTNSNNIQEF
ncbi:MAG: hypothetical protein BHV78_05975 [Bacteroides sp. CAG:1060_57_27]|nr:MAG: hypothetical protein BHV78_05975 [Bacteroides sp. CAG:1060_57_27]